MSEVAPGYRRRRYRVSGKIGEEYFFEKSFQSPGGPGWAPTKPEAIALYQAQEEAPLDRPKAKSQVAAPENPGPSSTAPGGRQPRYESKVLKRGGKKSAAIPVVA